MYTGTPIGLDQNEKLKGVSSKVNATIHILDGQSNHGEILDFITAKNIIEDSHKKSLEDSLETYSFITFADKRFSKFLEKRNRIIIPDEDDTLREFVIFEAARDKGREGYESQVYSHASYLELKKATILYPDKGYTGTASQHGGRALNDTGWQIGIVESKGTRTLTIESHTNPFAFLKRIAEEFDLELRFRVEHDGNKITGRYVDLLQRVGAWRGREVEFGKDLDGIKRVEKQDIVTALLGLGPERENGTRIEVLVEDDEALKRWGRVDEYGNLHHLIEPYEIQSEREEMTTAEARQYTRTALNKRINAQVTYEATIIDLENVPGMENKKIRFGDTIRIKDTKFNPPLYLEARVYEQTRSIKSQAKKDIKLGDFIEFTEEEVNAIWIMLRREIRKKIDIDTLKDYAEPKKVESDTPPEIKEGENPIWVDTSKTPKVSNVAIAGEWQKMTPTTPEEVNAYTKKQVDDKAEQALKDAKAYAENADNIKEGVIDVGAIPLRTSLTGARLEWDGVNGLVQYSSDGEPVSWLDLDANAHFANAFLSGRVEAQEGFFGENMRLVDGKLEIVRPDGAIWMQDGLVAQDYNVSSFDPYDMDSANYDGDRTNAIFNPFRGYYRAHQRTIIGGAGFRDVRDPDKNYTVRFTTYEFIHSARYIVIGYRTAVNSTNPRHFITVWNGSEILYTEFHERGGGSKYAPIILDLGIPTYERINYELRIGLNKSDVIRDEDQIAFRINRVYLTDFI